ncbi:MAG: NAD(+)/NADH kinase, partial [Flavobacterium sp.]|nr:NAD(+)/NADH kinase [Flavobacterium sp.]
MKIAIYGQYYQNSTEPIIRDIFSFFNANNIELLIERTFLGILYEKKLVAKDYRTFDSYRDLDSSIDLMVSIGGDGTILRAATLVRDSGIPMLGINAGRLGFLAKVQKDNIAAFLQLVIDKKYTLSERTLLSVTCLSDDNAFNDMNFAMNEVTVSRK